MPTGEIAPQQALQLTKNGDVKEDTSPPSLSPVNPVSIDKVNYFGLEVPSKLLWKGWKQGKEHTKHLVLKNLGVKTQKLKYKVPESRFFSTVYPKPIFLSAGSSFSLPVTFRPLENIVYDDKIFFSSKDGEFTVPLSAVLPQTEISIPIDLDFKMCAVKDNFSISFDVYNTGDVDTPLLWEVEVPFTVEPVEAVVKHKGAVKFTATFRPEAAYVYEATAICHFGADLELSRQTTFYGIGKFPHLLVSQSGCKPDTANNDKLKALETEINFGCVPVASSSGQWVELHNLSQVRTPFRVERVVGMSRMDTVFHCNQTQGVVPPMSLMRIPFTFSPHAVNMDSIDYFSVVSVGDISRSVIRCLGTSVAPLVELGNYSVNFMQIDLGRAGTKTLDIINNSDVDAVYQFELDCDESVFKFEATSGILKPHTTQTLVLKFVPQAPINYYRRIACLVHNQPPLFLDLLGTCHTETVKPAVLRVEHVSRYVTHVERGLSVIAPEQLNELLREGRLEVDKGGCLEAVNQEDRAGLAPNPSLREILSSDEYFNDGFHSDVVNVVPHVSSDIGVVDFGNCQSFTIPEERTVNITNHTRGKVTVQWMGGEGRTFHVTPSTLDIPPLKACSFRVTFKPEAPNKLYGRELECYVFYKSMRDYRLVEDLTHCPPWCLTVKCLGHTFMPGNETFLPRSSIAPPMVVFPAINKGEWTYRTVVMSNTGETPILYNLEESMKRQKESTKCGAAKEVAQQIFSIKPSKGILYSGYQVFTVRMQPTSVSSFSHDMVFRLNDNEKYDQIVHLCGSAESAEVLLDNEGCLYFKPTCVGTTSERTYGFKNVSRIPLRFSWKLDPSDAKVLKVRPEQGVIQPNQTMTQVWMFTPREECKYILKPTLVAWGQGLSATSSGGKKKQFSVRAIGQGSVGDMQTDQPSLDFGYIVVGSSASRRVNIFNNSQCSLHYRLLVDGMEEGGGDEVTSMRMERPGVEFDSSEGVIPARSKLSVTATLRPVRRMAYQYAVSYQLITPNCNIDYPAVHEPQHLLHLTATGVYPTMTVTDIRSQGSAVGISKKSLWNLFSLDSLNAYLDSDPSSEELMYNIATRHSTRKRPSIYTRAILDFNFSAAPLGSESHGVSMMLENNGSVSCDWAFMFPRDIQMEMGYWTESGDCDQDELHDMKVMDNKLFTVSPKKGNLRPGEAVTVTFSYFHTMAGTDRLPVLLKLARGREILLNFVGVTVEPEKPYIHFPSNKHTFNPVPVGEKISPKQVYELYNGGAVPVLYECDLTPLDIIRHENFDQPIFECLNPSGEIPPGRSVPIQWRFFPLEAKTYMVDIPIRVHNGDMAIVTFTGIGYDRRILGETMPFSDQPDMCGVPNVQSAEIPGQPGYLSMERISFGNMPLFSQARRMVFITNKSKDHSIYFEWHVTSQADTQFLNIYPVRGEIAPNEYKMCRVTFLASGVPSFYDLDLVCEVSDVQEYSDYVKQLQAWEKERERQLNEFTITEHDLDADMRQPQVVDIVDGPASGRLSKLDALAEGRPISTDGELSKYKTLPPIRQLTADEKRVADRRKRKKLSQLWQRPEAPKPFLLHLGITARTHDTRHFQANFPAEYCHFYVDRTLSTRQQQKQQTADQFTPPTSLQCSLAESNIVASVMGNCLRGLLDDTYFIQAVKKVMQEPIPYFCQFTKARPTSAPLSSTPRDDLEEAENAVAVPQDIVEDDDTPENSDTLIKESEMDLDVEETILLPESDRSQILASLPTSPKEQQRASLESTKLNAELNRLKEKQAIKKLPEFGNSTEKILENAVLNLMYEALSSEYSIVSKPRFIAMPRRSLSASSKSSRHNGH